MIPAQIWSLFCSTSGLENGYSLPAATDHLPPDASDATTNHCNSNKLANNSVANGKQNGSSVKTNGIGNGNGVGPPLINGSRKNSLENGKSNGQFSCVKSPASPVSRTPEKKKSPSKSSSPDSSLLYFVIFGALFAMAAVGIVSAQDWVSFLTVAAQLGAIGLLILAYIYRKWIYVAIKTTPRDIK
ncbi:unnamed protein product [Allacma fusca]|uniref:Uncharacterized protein n=1 Tax=Allacma fusca TaxID=39272 RepID=A0A8J2NRN4_9HEXA|nr:unnamed protein product [Allacma fusca]